VYAILAINRELDSLTLPGGYKLERHVASQPGSDRKIAMKWTASGTSPTRCSATSASRSPRCSC